MPDSFSRDPLPYLLTRWPGWVGKKGPPEQPCLQPGSHCCFCPARVRSQACSHSPHADLFLAPCKVCQRLRINLFELGLVTRAHCRNAHIVLLMGRGVGSEDTAEQTLT